MPDLAELKLVKLMQQDLNRRTDELRRAIAQGARPTAEQRDAFVRLAEEQGKLADLVLDRVATEAAAAGEGPDELPDLDLEENDAN